ncbi:MAG: hypothetical protein EBE86_009535 [Hormoscilla sp. GUM202]|nr:hypothetical protein [Hormoscilla sp. GUM202]
MIEVFKTIKLSLEEMRVCNYTMKAIFTIVAFSKTNWKPKLQKSMN